MSGQQTETAKGLSTGVKWLLTVIMVTAVTITLAILIIGSVLWWTQINIQIEDSDNDRVSEQQ